MNTSAEHRKHRVAKDQPDWPRIFDSVPDGLIITDPNLTILFVNRKFAAITDRHPSELIGRKCHDVYTCDLCHTDACPLARTRKEGSPAEFEPKAHCKIVKKASWLISAATFNNADGRLGGYIERITDATAFHQVQKALFRSDDRLRKNMGAIIQAMSTTIEKRDPYTAGHQRRVAKLCRAIATRLGFSWDRIQGLRMAAAIHDLGKIHVPAGILNKPGHMSRHELAIIRMHPRTGYEILKGIRFPWPLAETIYQHHERLDGSGYPRHLKGDQILLEARILSVADVVESMASFRPYRPELGLPAALAEIQQNRDILYDNDVVDACTTLITKLGFDFKTKSWQRGGDHAGRSWIP